MKMVVPRSAFLPSAEGMGAAAGPRGLPGTQLGRRGPAERGGSRPVAAPSRRAAPTRRPPPVPPQRPLP